MRKIWPAGKERSSVLPVACTGWELVSPCRSRDGASSSMLTLPGPLPEPAKPSKAVVSSALVPGRRPSVARMLVVVSRDSRCGGDPRPLRSRCVAARAVSLQCTNTGPKYFGRCFGSDADYFWRYSRKVLAPMLIRRPEIQNSGRSFESPTRCEQQLQPAALTAGPPSGRPCAASSPS
jgi:hypothetical protein